METEWYVSRLEARGRGGMVAAKTAGAAAAGTEILRKGGNAVDAAVATAFAAGVVEPWMNGIGGGGYLVVHAPGDDPAVVEYPMIAPAAARPEMFPLAAGVDEGLFGWPAVVDNINVWGYQSVAVAGTTAGLATALERWGTISLAEALAPAIRYAEEGVPIYWHTSWMIARDLATLRIFPETAGIFLDANGCPPITQEQANPKIMRQPDLARTLRAIASEGPRVMYEGAIGQAIADDLVANGAPFTRDDFANYQAKVTPALTTTYGGAEVHTIGGGTGGTTLVESLNIASQFGLREMGYHTPAALNRMVQAFRIAFADRFAWLGDITQVDVPVDVLTDLAYARERAAEQAADRFVELPAATAERVGITHGLGGSVPDYVGSAVSPGQMTDGST
ncbi:MAG: gamma-glutamyltransferase family protein, partial [Chloroflexota bacterium]|nr:gamma-glutamyltransferase family protein [Chloroflexota bacterium]